MKESLSEEVNRKINAAAPLIVFFGLPAKQQIKILPILEKETLYDFPEGDLLTNDALDVLTDGYQSYLNSILLWLTVMPDNSNNEYIDHFADLAGELLDETSKTFEWLYYESLEKEESLNSPRWDKIRQLSQTLQQELCIELEVNTAILTNCIDSWLHS